MPAGVTIAGRAEVGKPAPEFTAHGSRREDRVARVVSRSGPDRLVRCVVVPSRAARSIRCSSMPRRSTGSRLAIVSVMHDDLDGDARAFVREFHARWPAVNDESNAISSAYGVVGVPQTFFVTAGGVVQARCSGSRATPRSTRRCNDCSRPRKEWSLLPAEAANRREGCRDGPEGEHDEAAGRERVPRREHAPHALRERGGRKQAGDGLDADRGASTAGTPCLRGTAGGGTGRWPSARLASAT